MICVSRHTQQACQSENVWNRELINSLHCLFTYHLIVFVFQPSLTNPRAVVVSSGSSWDNIPTVPCTNQLIAGPDSVIAPIQDDKEAGFKRSHSASDITLEGESKCVGLFSCFTTFPSTADICYFSIQGCNLSDFLGTTQFSV